MSPGDELDARLGRAGWTCSMVDHWRVLRRHGWSVKGAAQRVKAERQEMERRRRR